jgi:O-antigen/teichoic acid export membrane protein
MVVNDMDGIPAIAASPLLAAEASQEDLKGRSIRGGAATLLGQGAHLAIQIASTAVLARLLAPQAFGLVAMVTAVTSFAYLFKDLGLAAATIQKARITQGQVSTLFWVNAAMGVLTALLTAALAPLIAWFYGEPSLTWIAATLALSFALAGLTVQHQALLRRHMRFVALAAIDVLAMLGGATAAIAAAVLGAGYWSLVIMQVMTALCSLVAVWLTCRWTPGLPVRRAGVRDMLGFGANLTGFNMVNYVARNLDNILIGRVWGAVSLGFYAKAYGLLMLPLRQVNAPIAAVAVPTLSRLQDDPARYRRYYLKSITMISFVTMPAVMFLIVMSAEVIRVALGPQWSPAGQIFALLGIAALTQPVTTSTGWLYVSQGRGRDMFVWGVVASTITAFGIVLGLPWGASGVAACYTLSNVVMIPLLCWFVGRKGPVQARDIYRATAAPAGVSLCVLAGLLIVRPLITNLGPFLRLACGLTAAGAIMAVALPTLPAGRQAWGDLFEAVAGARKHKPVNGASTLPAGKREKVAHEEAWREPLMKDATEIQGAREG